jgi:hypothetical protein
LVKDIDAERGGEWKKIKSSTKATLESLTMYKNKRYDSLIRGRLQIAIQMQGMGCHLV